MSFSVNTNVSALKAMTQLNRTGRSLSRSFERISSGLRISRAADDAAGLGVAENLKVAARSSVVAQRNINDGVSIISTAEGATSEVGNILARMRELAVESSSETLADSERAYIQDEYEALSAEVDRIANTTEFNGTMLTDGSSTAIGVQVGINATSYDQVDIEVGDLRSTTLGVDTASVDMSTSAGAQSALSAIDSAIDTVTGYRSAYGAVENRLSSALSTMENYAENLKAAESQIRDADFGYETTELSKSQILQQAGTAILAQAKSMSQGALQLLQ
jgi:flagellin